MSVAEKLRALEVVASGPQTYEPEPQEWEESAVSVMAALPQIVAVVEAAERLAFGQLLMVGNPDVWLKPDEVDARKALTALDEALSGAEHPPGAERT